MSNPLRHLAAIRTRLLSIPEITAYVGQRITVSYPWDMSVNGDNDELVYPLITIWQHSGQLAVSLPKTTDPCRVFVDIWSKLDGQEVAEIGELVENALHKQENIISTSEICFKEIRQDFNQFMPSFDNNLMCWRGVQRYLVRAMTR